MKSRTPIILKGRRPNAIRTALVVANALKRPTIWHLRPEPLRTVVTTAHHGIGGRGGRTPGARDRSVPDVCQCPAAGRDRLPDRGPFRTGISSVFSITCGNEPNSVSGLTAERAEQGLRSSSAAAEEIQGLSGIPFRSASVPHGTKTVSRGLLIPGRREGGSWARAAAKATAANARLSPQAL
jgi:hypothetical protein